MTTSSSRLSSAPVRVFLVDDHPIVRRGFQLLIALEPDMTVAGEADTGPAALEAITALKPDIAIVDLSLKSSSGLDLIKQLRVRLPRLKMLVFTMRDEGLYAERSLRAGANGYITKEEGTEKAIEAIRLLMQGKNYVSERMAAKMVNRYIGEGEPDTTSIDRLSDRELEVLEWIGRGLGSREIAEKLHVSIKTIESHREHIKDKLGLSRGSELAKYAFDWLRTRDAELGG